MRVWCAHNLQKGMYFMSSKPIRQGDVLLWPCSAVPVDAESAPRDQRGRLVLAYGEATGHAHLITDDAAMLFTAGDQREMQERFLRIEHEVALMHAHVETLKPGDHRTLLIPPGVYRVTRQREYTSEAARWVAD